MSETEHELISAFLDGELDAGQRDRVVTDLIRGPEQDRERLGHYRLIGDVLRGESAVDARAIAGRVAAALVDEPTVLAPPAPRRGWVKPVAGAAIAASVALAAVILAPQLLAPAGAPMGDVQLAGAGGVGAAPQVSLAASTATATRPPLAADRAPARWQTVDAALGDRLNRLVIEHHEFGGRTGINGPVAHIGLVSYDAR